MTVKINVRFGGVGDKENSKFMILVLSMITLVHKNALSKMTRMVILRVAWNAVLETDSMLLLTARTPIE